MKYIRKFNEGFFSKYENPNLEHSIDDIISYLENNYPIVKYSKYEDYLQDSGKTYLDDFPNGDVYRTSFNLDGEKIDIVITLYPLVPKIVINNYEDFTGKDRKILSLIKKIYNKK